MARKKLQELPGCFYQRGDRWYWKVQLPGEDRPKSRPLTPYGSRYATRDRGVAEEVARDILNRMIYRDTLDEATFNGTIAAVVQVYLRFAEEYYNGSREIKNVELSLRHLTDFCPSLAAEDFGPLKLKELRRILIENGLSRKVINQRINTIKRCFKWATSEQLIPPSVYHGLQTVDGLRRGRSKARETEPVRPVDVKHVYAVLPYAAPTVAAMIELQLLTGMRPGELVIMRPCDIDRSGDIWIYTPKEHKTAHHGHTRMVLLGPKCKKILKPFLDRQPDAFLFSPRESMIDIRREHYGEQRARQQKAVWHLAESYDRRTYRQAVLYAIKAAQKAGKEVPRFTPHQLRHTAATLIRKECKRRRENVPPVGAITAE